ncbi:MAG: alpha/beta hydrolase [Rhodospirillaceae bacterium]
MLDRDSHDGVLTINGVDLEYRWIAPRDATAPALVFLHEGLGSVSLWRDFPDAVAEETGCGALIYSRQGYGKSAPVALPRPLRYMHIEGLEVLPALLDAAGLTRVVLIGHSDGASIALIHAGGGDPGGRVRGLVLMAPHVRNEESCVVGIRQIKEAWETTDLRDRLARHHGANVDCAFRGWNDTWLRPDFWHWTIEEFLPAISVPTLVIQGEGDEYATAIHYDVIAAQVSGPCTVEVLPNCGHAPHKDQREAVLASTVRLVAEVR